MDELAAAWDVVERGLRAALVLEDDAVLPSGRRVRFTAPAGAQPGQLLRIKAPTTAPLRSASEEDEDDWSPVARRGVGTALAGGSGMTVEARRQL